MVKTSTLSILTATPTPRQKRGKTTGKICEAPETPEELNEPSGAVIDRILSYSKALSVKKSKSMGYVENLLN